MKGAYVSVGIVLLIFLFLSGCATISGGTTEIIAVRSTPSSAKLTIGGRDFVTPASIELDRGEKHQLVVEKEGYKKATVSLDRKFRGWAAIGGNVLWLLPGVVVDGLTGAWWELRDKSVHVILEPLESAPQEAKELYKRAIEEEKRMKAEEEKRKQEEMR